MSCLPSTARTLAHVPRPPAWTTLFNDPSYLALHLPAGARAVVLEHHAADGRLVGTLAGVLDGDRFRSGHSAPFGGVDLARPDETPANIVALVADVTEQLDALGVAEATIGCRPACHGQPEDTIRFALHNAGFAVAEADLSFAIELDRFVTADDWLASLRSPFRRGLRHADPDRFELVEATDDRSLAGGFELLESNRAGKGRALSIGLEEVRSVRDAFPGRVRLAELRRADAAVAAALSYRVSEPCELIVAWGDAGHDLPRSPMPVLALEIVRRAIAEGLRALDLGTSTLRAEGRRVPNDGLIQFKRNAGARAQLRPVLVRQA